MPTTRSQLMDKLYGKPESIRVYNMLEELDPQLNDIVQKIAYDYFWAREGLSIREKSLVTVATLLTLQKELQTQPHMIGFLNTGGSAEELIGTLLCLSKILNPQLAHKGLTALISVLKARGKSLDIISSVEDIFNNYIDNMNDDIFTSLIGQRNFQIVKFVAMVILGDLNQTKTSIYEFLTIQDCNEIDLRNILFHLIIYCGFPTAINGFSALKVALEKNIK